MRMTWMEDGGWCRAHAVNFRERELRKRSSWLIDIFKHTKTIVRTVCESMRVRVRGRAHFAK